MTLPAGDRLAQTREPYYANQQILANKQLSWWWNNPHYAVYANSSRRVGSARPADRMGSELQVDPVPRIRRPGGRQGDESAQRVLRCEVEPSRRRPIGRSGRPAPDLSYLPLRDDTIQAVAMEAIYEYWNVDGNNATVGGLPMVNWAFCCAWNWDARPFPTFPIENQNWGDTGNWQQGDWLNGIRDTLPPPAPSPPPTPPAFQTFPSIATLSWSVHIKPKFSTLVAQHVSGNETRAQRWANPYFDIELTYEVLRSAAAYEEIAGDRRLLRAAERARTTPFWFAPPGPCSRRWPGDWDWRRRDDGLSALVSSIGAAIPARSTGHPAYPPIYLNGVAQGSGWSVSTAICRRSRSHRAERASRSPATSASCGSAASPTTFRISRNSWRMFELRTLRDGDAPAWTACQDSVPQDERAMGVPDALWELRTLRLPTPMPP